MSPLIYYVTKSNAFEGWCQVKGVSLFSEFFGGHVDVLVELFEQGLSFSTLKVDMADISSCHVGIDGSTSGLILWWCGSTLSEPPFLTIEFFGPEGPSYKTALLMASAKRGGFPLAISTPFLFGVCDLATPK